MSKKTKRISIREEYKRTIANADKYNQELQYSTASNEGFEDSQTLVRSLSSNRHKKIIEEAINVYKTFGLIKNVVDVMTDFASKGIRILHKDPDKHAFYEGWARKVKLQNVITRFFSSVFKTGNVVVTRRFLKLDKSAVEKINNLGMAVKTGPKTIPIEYSFVNPASVELEGSKLFGKLPIVELDQEDIKIFKNPKTKEEKDLVAQFGPEFVKSIKDGKVVLDDRISWLGHYKKDDWEDWADPPFFAAIDDINFKRLLRRMDESVARNIINAITLIKLGKTVEGFPPTTREFEKFASLMKTPTKSKTIIWSDLVDMKTDYAPINLMLNKEKYDAVNSDILSAIGISEVLINGIGNNYASSFLSVKSLLEKLEIARNLAMDFLLNEILLINEAMGWSDLPSIRFTHINLRDERVEKQLAIELFDRAVLSGSSLLSYFNEDFDYEMRRIEQEKALTSVDVPVKTKKKRGRPPGTTEIPLEQERDVTPKGAGSIIAEPCDSCGAPIRGMTECCQAVSQSVNGVLNNG